MPDRAADPSAELPPSTPVPRVPVVSDLPGKVLAVKEADTFLYSDVEGNLADRRELGLGLYHRDTRYLSHFRLRVAGTNPILLSSSAERVYVSHVDLTNPDLEQPDGSIILQHTLNIRRTRSVKGGLYERIRAKNYNRHAIEFDIELSFGADFADIFEVRGITGATRGTYEPPRADEGMAEFAYTGEDDMRRLTRITFGTPATHVDVRGDIVTASFRVRLAAHETKTLSLVVEPVVGEERPEVSNFDQVAHSLRHSYEDWERESTQIHTDNKMFDQLLMRGLRDLRALYTRIDGGGIIAAGIPWYVAVFGRDSLITSHQMLMLSPRPARESLALLAKLQGTEVNDRRDEEPGKILHEIRQGELARSGFLPHTPYYGSVDSTPLFLILIAQYFRWTNDLGFVKELVPNIDAALRWIDEYGDLDGDGFVEYKTRSPRGLRNHGWKDSNDSVVHEDGTLGEGAIALAEVQAYVYMAKTRIADVFAALGDYERAVRLRDQATVLRRRFHEAFWMEDERFFAGALDGDKRQVRTIMSNPGHALYCGILDDASAAAVAHRLFDPDMFSGWGIRTMSKAAKAYNPMSYHNGSVWPHDNALIAAGLKRYGFMEETNRVASSLFEVAQFADYLRLPELFCGFTRRTPSPPVQYPVACSPQAWAAGAPFLLLQAMLGVSAVAHENLLTVNKPHLPPWLNQVELRNLRVGDSTLSVVFRREGDTTGFSLLSREGDVRVIMEE